MKGKNYLEVIDVANRAQALLDETRTVFENACSEGVRELAGRLPSSAEGDQGALRVVFAGQYSAGKSTVISALTGRDDIAIGSGITTQEVTSYDWSGVEIIDTPGIHTSLRPDHDELSYRALSEADLIVFTVTNELFDKHIAEHFRKLAIDRDKAHEMILLINKMGRHSEGNSLAARNVVTQDLEKVLAPFTPEELWISFTDAESALSAPLASSERHQELFWRRSGMDDFSDRLNKFIAEKGFKARYTTSLYVVEQVLQEALSQESSGDRDVDGLEEMLVQKRRALIDERQRLPSAMRSIVTQEAETVRSDARDIADSLNGDFDADRVNQRIEDSQQRTQEIANRISDELETVIGQRIEALESRIESVMNSELARELLPRLDRRVSEYVESQSMDHGTRKALKTGADLSQQLGRFLVKKSFSPQSSSFKSLFQLESYSGTTAHKTILATGKFLGKKFKPWEAVKWTKHLANTGRVLSVVGVAVSVYMTWEEDQQEINRERELAESRAAIRAGFSDAAHLIETHFDEVTQSYINDTFTPEIEAVDGDLRELRAMQTQRSDQFDTLIALLKQTQDTIREIHRK